MMWEKRSPQTFYEKVLHLGQQKAEHLDSFLLLSQNTKSFALYIIARNSDILLPPYSLASSYELLSTYVSYREFRPQMIIAHISLSFTSILHSG
jgi:hypothetical protein